jgi:hypothetical protein
MAVLTAIRPRMGRHRPFRALPADPWEGVVMLVPVLRGRAAVTLGHNTSLLGLDGSVTAFLGWPRTHPPNAPI